MGNPVSPEETLFHVARQLSHPQDRAAYLNDACGDDKALRGRVELLLQAERQANKFLANDPLEIEKLPASPTGAEGTANHSGSGWIVDRDNLLQKTPPPADNNACSAADRRTPCLSMATVAPAPGDVFEDYEIIEKIGGNLGLVFKARHRRLDKVVALKLLPAEWIADPARVARFQRELRIMGKLEHPNLVTAADARVVGCWHLVAMELIDGMDLERLVESQGPLPVGAACEAARQTALALQYAHQHGLIHRDIKPSNLMLTHLGSIKVIDMGLALIQEESTVHLTQTGLVMGTMRYCAPEQFRDASRVDIRADIYSLGCTLYHLLAGKPPYWQCKTFAEVVQAHLNEPFPSLLEARPDAPVGLEAVLARMTAKDPGARFATPSEVVEALEPFVWGADLKQLVPPKPAHTSTKASIPAKRATPAPAREARPDGQPRKTRWKLILAASILLLAIVGAIIFAVADRVIVLMDTTAPKGIYDPDNEGTGRSNADELYNGLRGLDGILLPSALHKEGIGLDWARDSFVIGLKPDLVIIHRSSFFHPLAAKMGLKYPPEFTNAKDYETFQNIYKAQDMRLLSFISLVGSAVPHCQFLVYSRGTDTNWLNPVFRSNWTATLESNLQKRIHTMVIPDQPNGEKGKGTFRDPATMEEIKRRVREMLKFPKRQEPEKRN